MMKNRFFDLKNNIFLSLLSLLLCADICFADSGAGISGKREEQKLSSCRLEQAEELYYAGDFEQALLIIEDCLTNHSPDTAMQIHAYTISARIHLVRGERTAAEQNITKILDLNPAFEPSIEEETPKFVNFIAEVRQKTALSQAITAAAASDSSQLSPWIWIGAGGAALAIFAILSGDNSGIALPPLKDQTLPAPPAFPND